MFRPCRTRCAAPLQSAFASLVARSVRSCLICGPCAAAEQFQQSRRRLPQVARIRAADLGSVSGPLIGVVAAALLERGRLEASEVNDAILGAVSALTRERLSE